MEEVLERLRQVDMVLVGLGEEFDDIKRLRDDAVYQRGRQQLLEDGCGWLVPAWSEYCSKKQEDIITPALEKLVELLNGRNYFVVSVSTNSAIERVEGLGQRLVNPCGSVQRKQCVNGCEGTLFSLTDMDRKNMEAAFGELYDGHLRRGGIPEMGKCSSCGNSLILNNIHAERYNENGYLDKWRLYTKWLQGTLNRRIFLLELGVGLQFPTVVRWPFEKIVSYNKKAFLCRVHEKLYQLPEGMTANGCGISKNAIDWLGKLC